MLLRRIALTIFASVCLASPALAGSMIWEVEFLDEADINGASIATADAQVDIVAAAVSDNDSGGPDFVPFGGASLFFSAEHGTTGNHTGYGFLGFDNLDDDPADYLDLTMTFSIPVYQLVFAVLDIDERTMGGASDFSDGLIITYNGGINVIGTPALYSLGPNVIVGDEGFGEFEGLAHGDGEASPGGSTDGNIAFDFGGTAVTSLSFRYFSTDDAPANPSGQLMGISDLSWIVPEPGTGVLVWAGLLVLGICQRRV